MLLARSGTRGGSCGADDTYRALLGTSSREASRQVLLADVLQDRQQFFFALYMMANQGGHWQRAKVLLGLMQRA